jgi:zinc transporter 1/2/3
MFLHMLPEVREILSVLQEEGTIAETDFSLPELMMCCGFFLMYLAEELIHAYLHRHGRSRASSEADDVIHRSFSMRRCSEENVSVENQTEDTQRECEDSSVPVSTILPLEKAETTEVTVVTHHHMPKFDEEHPVVSSVRGLLMVLALSVHEVFEGLAVGLQTSTSYVWYMLGAVSAHEMVIAFCVGIELVRSKTRFFLALLYVSTFSLVSPLGIGIGIGLTEGDANGGVASGFLQGISTGTLLYVVFFEVLQRQSNSNESGLLRLLAILVGFGVMFGLRIAGKITGDCTPIQSSGTSFLSNLCLQKLPYYTQDSI